MVTYNVLIDLVIMFFGLWVFVVTQPKPSDKFMVWYKELWFMFGWVIVTVLISVTCVYVDGLIE